MRWKLQPSGHDPRQIDLLAIVAMILILLGRKKKPLIGYARN